MELTEQERQLIEVIRANATDGDRFCLIIERQWGAWEVTISGPNPLIARKVIGRTARGTGTSFESAWDDMGYA
jgi:hypothetical protein